MTEIDGMDILGFLRVRAWNARREHAGSAPKHRYIDEVWQNLTPGATSVSIVP